MTYSIYDASANLGSPYELFRFYGPLGEYLYTNNNEPVTVGSRTYEPLQIVRGVTEINTSLTSIQTVDFTVPITCALFEDNGRALSPPDLTIEVYRYHRGTTGFKRRLVGTITGHSTKNGRYTLEAKSTVQTKLNRKIASVYYQNLCNHVLFDARCKVNPDDWSYAATVTAVTDGAVTLDDDQHANNVLREGTLIIGEEMRVILANVDNVILIKYPFIRATPGDAATIRRGCNLQRLTCNDVFDNIANYGGFPTIPTDNPALPDLEIINTTSRTRTRQDDPPNFWREGAAQNSAIVDPY